MQLNHTWQSPLTISIKSGNCGVTFYRYDLFIENDIYCLFYGSLKGFEAKKFWLVIVIILSISD